VKTPGSQVGSPAVEEEGEEVKTGVAERERGCDLRLGMGPRFS